MFNLSARIFVLILSTILSRSLRAGDSLQIETLDSLTAQIRSNHEKDTEEAVALFKNLKDYKWLHLLPVLGYNVYTHSPEVSISVSQWISFKTGKDAKKYQIEQIKLTARQDLEKKTYELRTSYAQLTKLLNELEIRHAALQINAQIFEIEQKKHENTEITTEEFLTKKRSYLQQQIEYQAFKTTVNQAITKIEEIIKRELVAKIPLLHNP
ncbi:MAG: TolC family protein [Planctomycetaceae bacterium]|jgi:hypothetical protein|nr:TolC family protein [Planctomycetaceae bacterium]